jgi:ferric hydroxamate transport system permease protein
MRRLVPVVVVVAALVATALNLGPDLLALGPGRALQPPPLSDHPAILYYYSALPRLAVALLAGVALGLSGALMQQVLRNPLASPSTLGVEAGAQLALSLAVLFLPALLGLGRDLAALTGAFAVTLVVLGIAGRFGSRPLVVILTGMMIGLYAQALIAILALVKERYLAGMFLWGAGSLVQQDWNAARELLPKILACAALAWALRRPLDLLQLDAQAAGLGLRVALARAAGLATAATLAGVTVSAVGIIGFLGLAAPALARLAGARRLGGQLLLAPLFGAALLTLIDQALQLAEPLLGTAQPAGAMCALIAAPVMLLMLRQATAGLRAARVAPLARCDCVSRRLLLLAVLVVAALGLAVLVGRDAQGAWRLVAAEDLGALLPWRLPRSLAAGAGGVMLAIAGTLLQRLTGNPMASPEILGVSAGAGLGFLCLLLLLPAPGYGAQLAATGAGAGLVLAVLLWLEKRAPEQILLAGMALGAFLTAALSAVMATATPRATQLLAWMSGAAPQTGWTLALATLALGAVAVATLPMLGRQAELLGLGAAHAGAAGVAVRRDRMLLVGFAAALTGAATLSIGPLSFIGLVAPHLARRIGLCRVMPQALGAACLGAVLMIAADFLGRTLWFPWQLPTGLVANVLAGAVFAALGLRRMRPAPTHRP